VTYSNLIVFEPRINFLRLTYTVFHIFGWRPPVSTTVPPSICCYS